MSQNPSARPLEALPRPAVAFPVPQFLARQCHNRRGNGDRTWPPHHLGLLPARLPEREVELEMRGCTQAEPRPRATEDTRRSGGCGISRGTMRPERNRRLPLLAFPCCRILRSRGIPRKEELRWPDSE